MPPPSSARGRSLRSAAFRWALVLVGLGGGASWLIGRLRPPEVRVAHPSRRPVIETVVATGRIMAPARVSIGAQLGGVVRTVTVREGDKVDPGQPLVQIDDAEQAALVAQARAQLERSSATLAKLVRSDLASAREAAAQADLALARAREELDRQRRLVGAGAGTARDLEEAQRAVARAESQQRADHERLADASPGGAEGRRAEAARAEADAFLRLQRARLAQARIVAPTSGLVLERHVEPGDLVQPGRELLVLAPFGETRVVAQLDEKDVAKLRTGQPALVSAEAAPDQTFVAEVSFIAPAIDPQRATIEVRLRVPEPPPYLRPEMTVSVDIKLGRKEAALVLPAAAVRQGPGETPWVLVVDGERAERRPVRLGLRGDGFVEVVEGIDERARVVLASTERPIAPGARVRVAEPREGGR